MSTVGLICKKIGVTMTITDALAMLSGSHIVLEAGRKANMRVSTSSIPVSVTVNDENDDTVYGPIVIPAGTIASVAVVGFAVGTNMTPEQFTMKVYLTPMRKQTVVRRASDVGKNRNYIARPDFSTPLTMPEPTKTEWMKDSSPIPFHFVFQKALYTVEE